MIIKKNLILIIIGISLLSLLISFIKLNKNYSFDWDQADDAEKVLYMIENKKPLLIGPRVSNNNGFFVGPYHYYYLLPFFILTKGDPIAGAYAVALINLLTAITFFLIVRKLFNFKIAIIGTLITIICSECNCWNAMYAPLISIITFYICYQTINKKKSPTFPIAMLFAGFISNIHLVPVSLVPIIIFSYVFAKKIKIKDIFLGSILFCLPFIPLIIFDFRHEFLNTNKLLLMFFNNQTTFLNPRYIWLRSFWRSLNIIGVFSYVLERILFLISIIITLFLIEGKNNKLLIIIWLFLPLLILSQYKGVVSEYYYRPITSLLPLFLSYSLIKLLNNKIIIYIIIIFSFITIYKITKLPESQNNLIVKKGIVSYLVNQRLDQPFNLSYETGVGLDFGFNYLFKFYKKFPQNFNESHLYTLFTNNTVPLGSNIVFQKGIYYIVRR